MIPRTALVSAILLLGLTGCSAAAPNDPDAAAAESESTETAAAPTSAAPSALPECERFVFDETEPVPGEVVASCITAAILAHNFGKMTVDSDLGEGLTTYRFRPEFAATVELNGDDLLFIDGEEMWFKDQLGWVEAVDDDSDPRASIAFMTASTFRGLSDPRSAFELIRAAPLWNVVGEEEIERPDEPGVTRNAWKISAAEPFVAFGELQISELTFWIDKNYIVLQQKAVSSALGETATTVNQYFDHGEETEFIPPLERG